MPYTKTNQTFENGPKYPEKHQLVVKRLYGPRAGETYVRTFSSEGELNEYIKRNTDEQELQRNKYHEYPVNAEKEESTILGKLKDWVNEKFGFSDLSKEEKDFYFNYYMENGELPSIWDDPYAAERALKFVDASMNTLAIAAGPGVALSAVKGAMLATKLGTSAVARAETKTALKSAVRSYYNELKAAYKFRKTTKVAKTTGKGALKY